LRNRISNPPRGAKHTVKDSVDKGGNMGKRRTPREVTLLAMVVAGGAMPVNVPAADAGRVLEEVIVSAQRRQESLQDVPVSVAVVSGEKIEALSLQNLDQLSRYVPGFTVVEGGEQTTISIRGFSTGLNFGFDQSVGMFVDGVYAGRERQFRSLFLDINSVEVLKGPQATLFGKSTTAGAVILTTGKPTHDFSTEIGAEYTPETEWQNYRAIINGGITDTLAGRLALRFSDSDGYMHNTFTGEDEEQEQDWVARVTLLWEPLDQLSITTKVEHSQYDRIGRNYNVSEVKGLATGQPTCAGEVNRNPPCAAATPDVPGEARLPTYRAYDPNFVFGKFDTNSKQRETADVEADNVAVRVDYDFSPDTRLSSISGYSAFKSQDQRDVDWSPTSYLYEPISEDFWQYSQEFQLTSKIGDRLSYIAGVHAYKNDFYVDRRTDIDINVFLLPFGALPFDPMPFGGPASAWRYANLRNLDQTTESLSAYLSVTYDLTPALHLNAGVRWNDETKTETDRVGVSEFGTTRYLDVTPDPTDPLNANPANPRGRLLGDPADVAFIENIRTVLPNNINTLIGTNNSRVGEEESLTFVDWSPEVKLSWEISDEAMVYARYAHAAKSGGFNSAVTGQDAPDRTFAPEEIDGYELGAKLVLLDRRLYTNLAVFYQELKDQQTSLWVGDGFFVGNAGKSRAQGVEADLNWLATDNLRINAAVQYLDAKYIEYEGVACSINQRFFPNPIPGCVFTPASATAPASYLQDLSGKRYSPHVSGTVGASYEFQLPSDLRLTWQANAVYTPEGVFPNDPTIVQDSRTIVDTGLSLSAGDESWNLGVLVRNATDKEYYYYEFEAPGPQIGTRIGFPAAPRTYTIQGTYRFK
jgi:iron complex outermembrane receptor protein